MQLQQSACGPSHTGRQPRDSKARAERAVLASPWVTFEHGDQVLEVRSQKFRCVPPSRKVICYSLLAAPSK